MKKHEVIGLKQKLETLEKKLKERKLEFKSFEQKIETLENKLNQVKELHVHYNVLEIFCKNCEHRLFLDEQKRFFHWHRSSSLSSLCEKMDKQEMCCCINPIPKQEKVK